MEFNICDQRKDGSIVADYSNEYTKSFHHGEKDVKYYSYIFFPKATKESITKKAAK